MIGESRDGVQHRELYLLLNFSVNLQLLQKNIAYYSKKFSKLPINSFYLR